VNLPDVLSGIHPAALTDMSKSLDQRAANLAADGSPEARAWSVLYAYLSVEMDCAAIRSAYGISI